MVPALSLIFMVFTCIFCIAFPIGLLLFVKFKYKSGIAPFFIGCATFLVFALVLEQILHVVVINVLPFGKSIVDNIWLYALYGGLAAGVFEETGRLVAMKFILKKWHGNDANALMYGVGHGGFEAMAIVSLSMISNIATALVINTGNVSLLTAGQTDPTVIAQVQAAVDQLVNIPSYVFLLSALERVSAIIFHIAASVIVWVAVTRAKKLWLYLVAILLHFLLDAVTVVINGMGVNNILLEVAIFIIAVAIAAISFIVWKKNPIKEVE